MPRRWRIPGLILSCWLAGIYAYAQATAPYHLSVSVDEVDLTFHAEDAHGSPIHDLKLDELTLLDNGRPPEHILAFQPLLNFPIRAGLLIDTSVSVSEYLARNRAIAREYADRLMRQKTDQAFIMNFDFESRVVQPWTSDRDALVAAMGHIAPNGVSRLGGTAILDSIYRACLNQFGRLDRGATANFILLFSDGEDNASHASLNEAVEMCQQANTAIYAFRADPSSSFSDGPKTLEDLAVQTGGRVFKDDASDEAIYDDLRVIEADLRDQYRLIYKPAELKHDDSFHRIALIASPRVSKIKIRSGYYAPNH